MLWRSVLVAAAVLATASPAGGATSLACRTGDLRVTHLESAGATGHGIHIFRIRNTSQRTCHTFGWFGVQLLAKHGRELPTRARRVKSDFFGAQPRRRVTIRPAGKASFRITTTAVGSGRHCSDAAAIRVIAPDDTVSRLVRLRSRRSHIFACERGRFGIAPIQRGDGADPQG
jgi:hypothetical protein